MSVRQRSMPVDKIVTIGINCDNCSRDIPLVFPDAYSRGVQGKRLLTVTLSGGYGEYMDGSCDVHLCEACASALLDGSPILKKAVDHTDVGGLDWRISVESQGTTKPKERHKLI